jgi:Periplasmic protease
MKNSKILKGLGLIGRLIIHILILGIIPLNMYMMNINEAVAVIITVGWVIAVRIIEQLIRGDKKSKLAGRIFFVIMDALVILLMIVATYFNIYWNSSVFRDVDYGAESADVTLTSEQALKDFDYAMKYLKKIHPEALHGMPKAMEERAKTVREGLKNRETIKGYELCREIEGIFSMLNDGHTFIQDSSAEYHYMKHIYENKKIDSIVVGVNGSPLSEFIKQDPGLISYETEAYALILVHKRISTLEGLRYLGVDISKEITYTYLSVDDELYDVTVTAEDFLPMEEYLRYEEEVTGDNLHEEEPSNDFVRYEIFPEKSLAVMTLDSCTYNSHYKETVKAMFEEIADKGIKNVAVDLRDNSGGSSLVANEFIRYLDVDEYSDWADEIRAGCFMFKNKASVCKNKKVDNPFTGKVYVLTSTYTYSSAMDFAMLIQDNGIGEVIGEASGNMPGSYGEISEFVLPESGLIFQVSSKKWHRVNQSKDNLPIMPDYSCDEDDAMDELFNIIEY